MFSLKQKQNRSEPMEIIKINNEELYPCVILKPWMRKAIELNAIQAQYRLETAQGYNSTVQAERAYIKANKALKRLQNNVQDGVLYCTYLEKRFIKSIINEHRPSKF
jgi:hypothetical protein